MPWSTRAGDTLNLGTTFEFVPLYAQKYFQEDYDPAQGAKFPRRFNTKEEMIAFGGCLDINPPPGKQKCSAALTMVACIPAPKKLPPGIPVAKIDERPYVPVAYYLSRSAYRQLGKALIMHSAYSQESLCERTFRAESRQEVQRGGVNRYHIPLLRHLGDEGRNTPKAIADFKRLASTIAGLDTGPQAVLPPAA